MKVLVLGAGLLGTTSAWYLARAGHEVTVLDRQAEPALETSFANGGQISVSHSEPWANPTAPLQILRWLGREDAPLLFRWRLDPAQWQWGARFLMACAPGAARRNTAQAFALAAYSRLQLQELVRETGIEYDRETRGILHLYEDPAELKHAHAQARLLGEKGFELKVIGREQCVAVEPALAGAAVRFAGGAYAPSDESGDARRFTTELARRCAALGVRFRFNVSVERIDTEGGAVSRIRAGDAEGASEALRADAYVVALGSYSRPLLAPIGLRLPLYPVKGYSITLPLAAGDEAPRTSLTDHARKIVFSRLGERLRVAGTAELNGFDSSLNEVRCGALIERCRQWFPRAGRAGEAQCWAGLRPATPNNLPLIGRTALPNLYLNTGHGTLGWTLACGSSRALAELLGGRRPEPDFGFLGLQRQRGDAALPPAAGARR